MSPEALAFLIIFVLLGCVMFALSMKVVRDAIMYEPSEIRQAKEKEMENEREYEAKTQDLGRAVSRLYLSLLTGKEGVDDETKEKIEELTKKLQDEDMFPKRHGAGLPITIATNAFHDVIPYYGPILRQPYDEFLSTSEKLDATLRDFL